MKEFYAWIVLILILLLVLFKIDSATNHHKLLEQYEFDKKEYQKQIDELGKEIRVLKTDIYFLQYGYENNEWEDNE